MERTHLKPGTRIQLEHGSLYEIIGEPIGSGGGSVIYPACQLLEQGAALDGIVYALKECYPISYEHRFFRDSNGQICPQHGEAGSQAYLDQVKEMQMRERQITQQIYKTSSRLLPIRESASRVALTLPDGAPVWVENTVTVMESLSAKGQSLESYLHHCRRMTTAQTFHIIRQLLFALREVHRAGYLHLDLQGKNLFLRGDLSDGSDMVTIIDFGSSRPLVNGRTEPIRDRVIFTTRGFSAPEILRENDGSLQLGPEADLYSVGCLILYLLTGSVYSPEELQSNTTGLYLTRFKLRRIDCPKHLVPRLQAIIARALEKRPEDRYHSAGEMLEDVGDFCAALQPYRSDLAAVTYDAFLCYRHGPVDSPAARTLQRSLEQFRTAWGPGSRRPFDRVFLDEGELSSCADMGEQIRAALKNAGWLVVICSPATPSSPWVQLEIDTFLEYHDRSRILAVLTAGEPEESFPPQLLARDGHQEVLAADARGKDLRAVLRKLRQDALFRIAAPMLGTTYDALRQRRQIYRLQRAAVATTLCLAAAIVFSIYALSLEQIIAGQAAQLQTQTEQLILQTQQLEEEYQNTLLEQSRYLLGDAQDRLAENDVLGAIQRLVAALPSEDQDRPVLPEAVYTLTEALGVYESPGNEEGRMTPVSSFALPDNTDSNLLIDSTGQYLFTATSTKIYVWDAEKGELIRTLNVPEFDNSWIRSFADAIVTPENSNLIVDCRDRVCCWDYLTGELLWQVETDAIISSIVQSKDTASVFVLDEYYLRQIGIEDGNVMKTIQILEVGNEKAAMWTPLAISDDGKKAAFSVLMYTGISMPCTRIYLADLEQNTFDSIIDLDGGMSLRTLDSLQFFADSLVIYTSGGGDSHIAQEFTELGTFIRYDCSSEQISWNISGQISVMKLQNDHTDSMLQKSREVNMGLVSYDDETERICLAVLSGNSIYLIDWESGELLKDYVLNSPIIAICSQPSGLKAFTYDGMCYPDISNDTEKKSFSGPITDVQWDSSERYYYVMQEEAIYNSLSASYRIAKYEHERDSLYYTEIGVITSENSYYPLWVDGLFFSTTEQNDLNGTLHVRDFTNHTMARFHCYQSTSFETSCRSADGENLYCIIKTSDGNYKARSFHLNDETWQDYDFPALFAPEENVTWTVEANTGYNGRILSFGTLYTEDDISWVLCLWAPNEEIEAYEIPFGQSENGISDNAKTISYIPDSFSSCESSETVQFCLEQKSGQETVTFLVSVRLDSLTSTEIKLGSGLYSTPVCSNSGIYTTISRQFYSEETGSTNTEIFTYDSDGKLLYNIPYVQEAANPTLFFSPNDSFLCAVDYPGYLKIYDSKTGSMMHEIDLRPYTGVFRFLDFVFSVDGSSLLLINRENQGILLDFSMLEPGITAIIPNCLGYDSAGNRFIVGREDTNAFSGQLPEWWMNKYYRIGAFHHYSLQELVELGQARVGQEQSGSGETEDP